MNIQDLADDLCSGGLANARRAREKSRFMSGTVVIGSAN